MNWAYKSSSGSDDDRPWCTARFSLKQSCTSMVSPSRWAERATAEAEYVDVFSSGVEEGYSPMTIEVYHSAMTASIAR